MIAVVGEASLPFRKDEKGRIGEVVPSSCKRFKLSSICAGCTALPNHKSFTMVIN